MRCALFFDATRQIQAAWYDPDAGASVLLRFSELRAKVRASSEREYLVFVADPCRRLREAGNRAFNDVVFIDPVTAAIREWVAADERSASTTEVVVLECDSNGSLHWELRVFEAEEQAFLIPADANGKSGGFVPAVPGAFDVGLERFLNWFQHQECSNVILTGAGIENVGLTDELAMRLRFSVFRCEHASVLGASRPPVESKYRRCDRWIKASESYLAAGDFEAAIDAFNAAAAVFESSPESVKMLGFDIRRALLGAADSVSDADKPGYLQKALLLPCALSKTADERDESDAYIYTRLAYCYCRLGDYASAEEAYLGAAYLSPDLHRLSDIPRYIAQHRWESFEGE